MIKAPICTYARHRLFCDGDGITTLVAFYGCPLDCRWCINKFTHSPDGNRTNMTPQDLYDIVKIDDLYFCATNGGITFGGGEPLLYPEFIKEFRNIAPEHWHICVETSLAVPKQNVLEVANCVDTFYIDCKDVNTEIYCRYTGCDNKLMLDNVKALLQEVSPEKIIVRVPLIPEYNTQEDQNKSCAFFEKMGITQFDKFTYTV